MPYTQNENIAQYVGARYVPKFYQNSENPSSNEWEAGTAYEAMTIVTYNNSSYTSKKPVNAAIGNPADNPKYWVITGNYNAQVEQYRQETQNLDEKVTNEVQARENADKVQLAIASHNFTNRRFILIGDSYGEGWTPDGVVTGWCEQFKNILGLTSEQCYYNSFGGSRFVPGGTMSFLAQLQNYIRPTNKDTITDIIVGGGFNDQGNNDADIISAITNFATYARENYPNAAIWIAPVGWTIKELNGSNGAYTQAKCYNVWKSYRAGCITNGCNFIPYAFKWAIPSNFSSDAKHPNANGNYLLAEQLIMAVLTGDCIEQTYYPNNSKFAPNANGDWSIRCHTNKESLTLTFAETFYGNFSNEVAKPWDLSFSLPYVTLNDSFLIGNYIYIPLNGYVSTSDIGYREVSANLEINDGNVNIRIISIGEDHNSFVTGAITNTFFKFPTVTIPLFNFVTEE